MIITFKIPHGLNLAKQLEQAKLMIDYSFKSNLTIAENFKAFQLPIAIKRSTLKKYCSNKKTKKHRNIKLIVSKQEIVWKNNTVHIKCLKIVLPIKYNRHMSEVYQIELDNRYIYMSGKVENERKEYYNGYVGVDINLTGYFAVVANPNTGKVLKLGKSLFHIKKKYRNIRVKLLRQKKYKAAWRVGRREARIINNMCHQISAKIVKYAKENHCGIKLENLKGIRLNKGEGNYFLNNWPNYKLRVMILYKAKLLGIKTLIINPYNTSKKCSRTGEIGYRRGKYFKSSIGVEHADVNAAFNIALARPACLIIGRKSCQ